MNTQKIYINRLLKQAREDVRMRQSEARENVMSATSYSKMEHGKKLVHFEEAILILQNLGIPVDDFVTDYVQLEVVENIRIKFKNLFYEQNERKKRKELTKIYRDLANRYPNLQKTERLVYYEIKTAFHKVYPELIEPITHAELRDIFKYIKKNKGKKLFLDDYRIISHTIMDMDTVHVGKILDIVFPIDSSMNFSTQKLDIICNIFLNVLTPAIKRKDFKTAEKILKIAKDHFFLYDHSYFFKLHLNYLENLYLLVRYNSTCAMEQVTACLKTFDVVESKVFADMIRKEVSEVLNNEKKKTNLSENDIIVGNIVR